MKGQEMNGHEWKGHEQEKLSPRELGNPNYLLQYSFINHLRRGSPLYLLTVFPLLPRIACRTMPDRPIPWQLRDPHRHHQCPGHGCKKHSAKLRLGCRRVPQKIGWKFGRLTSSKTSLAQSTHFEQPAFKKMRFRS